MKQKKKKNKKQQRKDDESRVKEGANTVANILKARSNPMSRNLRCMRKELGRA